MCSLVYYFHVCVVSFSIVNTSFGGGEGGGAGILAILASTLFHNVYNVCLSLPLAAIRMLWFMHAALSGLFLAAPWHPVLISVWEDWSTQCPDTVTWCLGYDASARQHYKGDN